MTAQAAKKPTAKARTTRPAKTIRHAPTPRDRYPAISIFGAHVGEALTFRPFDDKGRTRKDAARALEKLLRCRQNGARHRLHPRLGDALYQIGRHFPGHRVEIFSGYRPRAYCSRAHSRHLTGAAIDFHVEGVDNETLIAYLKKTFHPAGVGAYPHGVHVHLDLDRSVDTYWVDAGPPAAEPSLAGSAQEADPDQPPAARDSAPLPEVEPEPTLPVSPAAPVAAPAEADAIEPPAGDPVIEDEAAAEED